MLIHILWELLYILCPDFHIIITLSLFMSLKFEDLIKHSQAYID